MDTYFKSKGLDGLIIYRISQFLIFKSEYDSVISELHSGCANCFKNSIYKINHSTNTYNQHLVWWPSVKSMSYIIIENIQNKKIKPGISVYLDIYGNSE